MGYLGTQSHYPIETQLEMADFSSQSVNDDSLITHLGDMHYSGGCLSHVPSQEGRVITRTYA